jgi:hypothetical protein
MKFLIKISWIELQLFLSFSIFLILLILRTHYIYFFSFGTVFVNTCVYIYLCNMNVHMKNIQTKYKLNFKTMKKGLLTLLAASLVFVGCQNYDDQFDDLNAQISALKSQVDGLSSLSF